MQYTEVVTITPDMAREWLKMNIPNNRPLNRVRVRQYAADMRAGAWVLTHQGIAFSNRGLEDGQNRLAAIIEAGVPVTMNVTRGMEFRNDVLTVIDGGKARSLQDMMKMSGIEDPKMIRGVQYIKCWLRYKAGIHQPTHTDVIRWESAHEDVLESLVHLCRGGNHVAKYMNACVGSAVLSALLRKENMDALTKFSAVYRMNDTNGCEGYNPKHALNLRDYAAGMRMQNVESIMRAESAIWCFAHNAKRLTVRDDYYPYNALIDQ